MARPKRQTPEEAFAVMRAGAHEHLIGFTEFIRERGVSGLAIGFVLGTSVQKLVTSFVTDIVSPAISIVAGRTDDFAQFHIGPLLIGDFAANFFNFLLLVILVYAFFTSLKLERLDKPKE
jgi:large-conductance mechanosensitive channel